MYLKNRKEISDKTIFVTGSTGLIGSSFIKSLLQWNEQENLNLHILALVRSYEKAQEVFHENYHSDTIKFLLGGGRATP